MVRRLRMGVLNLLLGIIDRGKIKKLSRDLGVDKYVKVHRTESFSIDGMFIRLNKAVYQFAEKGYSAMDKGMQHGAKVHTALFNRFLPIAISITSGDVHDSDEFEGLMEKVLGWLSSTSKNLVFVMDKGYYSFPRFQDLVDRGISFVSPMKANGLNVGRITAILSPL
ncbi:MAG: transposase, partial [Candidatus Bathyarchaeia archaeon]